jgi:splicing factor 3B subunit 3
MLLQVWLSDLSVPHQVFIPGHLVLLETDHNSFTENSKSQRKQQMAEEMVQTAGEYEEVAAAEAAENFLSEELPENVFGAAKAGSGMWASCLRVMHPTEVSRSVSFSVLTSN